MKKLLIIIAILVLSDSQYLTKPDFIFAGGVNTRSSYHPDKGYILEVKTQYDDKGNTSRVETIIPISEVLFKVKYNNKGWKTEESLTKQDGSLGRNISTSRAFSTTNLLYQ